MAHIFWSIVNSIEISVSDMQTIIVVFVIVFFGYQAIKVVFDIHDTYGR
jgi:hypothetical protein